MVGKNWIRIIFLTLFCSSLIYFFSPWMQRTSNSNWMMEYKEGSYILPVLPLGQLSQWDVVDLDPFRELRESSMAVVTADSDRVLRMSFPLWALKLKALRVIREKEGTGSTHTALRLPCDYRSQGLTVRRSNYCQCHPGFGSPSSLGDNIPTGKSIGLWHKCSKRSMPG